MKLDFGTAGMRGIVGDDENQLNQAHVARVFDGYAKYLLAHVENARERGVVIGRDNRLRGKIFTNIAAKILTSYGIKVYFNNKMLATPFISFLTMKKNAAGAINVTASHNPKIYNGIKIYNQFGYQMLPDEVNLLKQYFLDYEIYLTYFNFKEIIKNDLVIDINEQDYEDYLNSIRKLNFSQTDLSNLKIVYSALHGTGYFYVSKLFSKSGPIICYEESEIIEDEHFGDLINPNPEYKEAFKKTIVLANQNLADLILITDPDSDRLGVAVKKDHDFVLLNGNEIAILICNYLLDYIPLNPDLNYGLIYSMVSTSLPEVMAKTKGIKAYLCETGFKWIGNLIQEFSKQDQLFFGFEESYGYLVDANISRDKDAIQAFYLLVVIGAIAKKNNQSLLDLLANIYEKYGYLKTETLNFDLKSVEQLKSVKTKFKALNLDNSKFIDYNESGNSDMMVYRFNDSNSWIALRPSGTEPKYKIYLHIVDKNELSAKAKFETIKKIFKDF